MASVAGFDVEEARSLEVGLLYSVLNVGKLGCIEWQLRAEADTYVAAHEPF